LIFKVCDAEELTFSWSYTPEEQVEITKFKMVMDGGTNVVVDDIHPDARQTSFELVGDDQAAHTFGLFACSDQRCSDMSAIVVYNPMAPSAVSKFLITVEAVQ